MALDRDELNKRRREQEAERDFLKKQNGCLSRIPHVRCSNYIGDAVDMTVSEEFREVLLIGHIGKLVKLAGGMFNTHSKYGDCRMDILSPTRYRTISYDGSDASRSRPTFLSAAL